MTRLGVLIPCLLLLVLPLAGCDEAETELQLSDLTEAETFYVTRIIVLERAKAVALIDRKLGNTLLDSLNADWGDSSLHHTLADTPTDPNRARQLHLLLVRMLKAERDSLVGAARPDRLSAPLPDPPLPEPEPETPK